MNSQIVIQVKVLTAQAMRQLQQMQGQLGNTGSSFGAGAAAAGAFGSSINRIGAERFGSQMQWLGRQLEYNFTLPLAAAGVAAGSWALANEKAMTRVKKVYGDGTQSADEMKAELGALGKAFEALSNHFGVAQSDVINIAADWAAAGASGLALAKVVKLTMETMVLGEIDAKKATEALIAIQAQYNFSTKELADTISTLNVVENQTGISLAGLIDGFSRSAGVARATGVDMRHLAAMLAAMVPATGSAAQAGNALKTILSRLVSPTQEMVQVMDLMGLKTDDMAWKSASATDKLLVFAKTFDKLDGAQKNVVSSVMASRFQINKFEELVKNLNSTTGYYAKALQATADDQKIFAQTTRELNAVLTSNPKRLEVIWTMLKNAAADIIQPMIPLLLAFAAVVQNMVTKFSNLNPSVQKLVLGFLLMLALVGPVVKYLGAFRTLIAELGNFMTFLGRPFGMVVGWFKALAAIDVAKKIAPLVGVFGKLGNGIVRASDLIGRGVIAAFTNIVPAIFLVGGWIGRAWAASMSVLLPITVATGTAIKAWWLTSFWPAIARIMVSGAVVVGVIYRSFMTGIWTTTMINFSLWGRGWRMMLTGLQNLVIAFAGPIGVAWRAIVTATATAFAPLYAFMSNLGRGLLLLWQNFWMGINYLFIAGARAAGVIYRSMVTGIWTITMAAGTMWRAAMIAALAGVQRVLTGFAALVGGIWRGIIVGGSIFIAQMGVVLRTLPAVLIGVMRGAIPAILGVLRGGLPAILTMVRGFGTALTVAFSGPWGWAIAAVILLFVLFWKDIKQIWTNIVSWFRSSGPKIASAFSPVVRLFDSGKNAIIRAFNALPAGIQGALIAVVRTVRAAAMKVYELFSYLNPWAHHSPSLVENVTSGVAEIRRQYTSLGDVGQIFKDAGMDLESFGAAVRRIQDISDAAQFARMRIELAAIASDAIPQWDALYKIMGPLRDRLNQIDALQIRQEQVVKGLKQQLDAANAAYDEQNTILQKLKDSQQKYQDLLDAATTKMQNFASTPIQGMKAMNDAIFANTMDQKKLQLQLMKMEDAVGPLDKLQGRLDAIRGQMELLRGEQTNLRNGGAGSEITKPYDAMIVSLEKEQKAIADQVLPLQNLQNQIDQLGRKGQQLDLTNSLQFDPLKKQIEDVATAMKELPFDQIMAGVTAARSEVDQYTAALASATAGVVAQQLVVDQYKAVRDALQATYDMENQKLQDLRDSYSNVNDAIQKVSGSLQTMHDAATAAHAAHQQRLTPGAQNFIDAAGGNFPDPGGTGVPGREGNAANQTADIEKFTKDLADQTKNMFGMFSFMEPIKKKWNEAIKWLKDNVGPMISVVGDGISSAFSGLPNPFEGSIGGSLKKVWDDAKSFIEPLKKLWNDVFGPEIQKIVKSAMDAIKEAFARIWPELQKFQDLVKPLGKLLSNVWDVLKPILGVVFGLIASTLSTFLGAIGGAIGPFIRMIGDVIGGLIRIIRGIIEFLVGIFTGDIDLALKGVVDVFGGAWDVIWGIINGAVQGIWGLVKGFVEGLVKFFKWLYDVLVGHSIIPDMVNAIVDVFNWFVDLAGKIWQGLWSAIKFVLDLILAGWNFWWGLFKQVFNTVGQAVFNAIMAAWNGVQSFFKGAWDFLKGLWNDVLKGMAWVYDNILKPVFDKLVGAVGWARDMFKNAVDGIKSIWDGLKDIAAAPVRFVIDTVLNKGLIRGWNYISDNVLGGKWHMPNVPSFAGGGHIKGAGGPKSDSIWAKVSNGEYVIPTKTVSKLGVGFFDWLIGKPTSKQPGDGSQGLAFAGGGLIGDVWDAITDPGKLLKKFVDPLINQIPGSGNFRGLITGTVGNMVNRTIEGAKSLIGSSSGDVGKAQTWLRTQAGKPYIWASAGPDGYDCSGIVSAVWNIMHGRNPYSHTFSTSNQAGYFPQSGPGVFTAGWANPGERGGGSVGHTAGVLAGLPFESRGGAGVVVGNGVTPVNAFAHIGHYDNGGWMQPGVGGYYNGTRKPEAVLTGRQWGYVERMVDSKLFSDPQSVLRGGHTYNEIHFHGDLTFPNIKNSNDAEEFIKNLESLAHGV